MHPAGGRSWSEAGRRVRRRWAWGLALGAGLAVTGGAHAPAMGQAPGLPPADVALRVDGPRLVDRDGQPVVLRAINLGNWLLIEPWMYDQVTGVVRDQATFLSVLRSRFGPDETDRLIGLHRAGWMTQRDFDTAAAAGFNCVRIPVSHVVLESEPLVADEAGFELLAGAMAMAERAGLYVVLDMHSVPGGQSTDQPSGDVTANGLWTDPEAQERLVWLWQRIARRFKNTPNFVAYDLINEPYGDFSTDVRAELLDIVDRTVEAIRAVDPDRLILAPGALQGIRFYGDPAARGWSNVGFTEHFYPGLFDGSPPTLGTHARVLASTLRDRADLAQSLGVPYFWGEFNPVFDRAGAPELVREVFDRAESLGVHSGIWTLKRATGPGGVRADNWYLTTNAAPLGLGDIRTSPLSAIDGAFSSLGSMALETDGAMVDVLTGAAPASVLPRVEMPPLTAPARDAWNTWSIADIGAVARPGGQAVGGAVTPVSADVLTLYGAGLDLFGREDSLRLASRAMPSDFVVSGVFGPFEGARFAQAGVTVRASESAGAPHVSLLAFPDGRVYVKSRGIAGATTSQRHVMTSGFPVGLAIGRSGDSFVAWGTNEDGQWEEIPLFERPGVGTSPRAGFFGLANRAGPLSVFRIADARLDVPARLAPAPVLDSGVNLLGNPSFETSAGTPSVATGWSPFGERMTREVDWVPVRQGSALLAYRHWETTGNDPSGATQVVGGLVPGERYVLTVYANRDAVGPGRALAEAIELRVETTGSNPRWLESARFEVERVATGSRWSRLQVRFVATDAEHLARVVVYPGSGQRDGAVKFDGLVLEADRR